MPWCCSRSPSLNFSSSLLPVSIGYGVQGPKLVTKGRETSSNDALGLTPPPGLPCTHSPPAARPTCFVSFTMFLYKSRPCALFSAYRRFQGRKRGHDWWNVGLGEEARPFSVLGVWLGWGCGSGSLRWPRGQTPHPQLWEQMPSWAVGRPSPTPQQDTSVNKRNSFLFTMEVVEIVMK